MSNGQKNTKHWIIGVKKVKLKTLIITLATTVGITSGAALVHYYSKDDNKNNQTTETEYNNGTDIMDENPNVGNDHNHEEESKENDHSRNDETLNNEETTTNDEKESSSKETESKESESSSSNKDEKKQEDKENDKNKNHDYKVFKTEYSTNNDGTHTLTTTYKCSIHGDTKKSSSKENCSMSDWIIVSDNTAESTCAHCGYKKTKTIYHEHSYGSYVSLDDDLEVSTCACGHTKTRAHKYGSAVDNGNGTETKTCSTCGHSVTTIKGHEHSWGNWYSKDDNKEERKCNSCNDKQTRNHSYGSEVKTLEKNSDGTHTTKSTYTCSTCGHKKVVTKKENCTSDNVVHYKTVSGVIYEYNTCTVCGNQINVKKHNHSYSETGRSNVTYNNNETHSYVVHKSCACGSTKDETVTNSCTSDNVVHYSSDKTKEYNLCTVCNGKLNEHSHTHGYSEISRGSTTGNGNGTHSVTIHKGCGCGSEKDEVVTNSCTSDNILHFSSDKTKEYNLCTVCGDHLNERSHSHGYSETGRGTTTGNGNGKHTATVHKACNCGSTKDEDETNYCTSDNIVHLNPEKTQEYNLCTVCGDKINVTSHNHSYGSSYLGADGLYEKCSTCGYEHKIHTHATENGSPVTVASADVCYKIITYCTLDGCTYSFETPFGHNWYIYADDDDLLWKQCTDCQYEIYEENPVRSR